MGLERRKPVEVRAAQLNGDTEALRKMQKESVKSAKNNRAERKENKDTTLLEAALHEAQLENDAVAIAHYEQVLREIRGEQ